MMHVRAVCNTIGERLLGRRRAAALGRRHSRLLNAQAAVRMRRAGWGCQHTLANQAMLATSMPCGGAAGSFPPPALAWAAAGPPPFRKSCLAFHVVHGIIKLLPSVQPGAVRSPASRHRAGRPAARPRARLPGPGVPFDLQRRRSSLGAVGAGRRHSRDSGSASGAGAPAAAGPGAGRGASVPRHSRPGRGVCGRVQAQGGGWRRSSQLLLDEPVQQAVVCGNRHG